MRWSDENRDYWFPAKRFGWGWGPPNRWQGWVVLAGYIAALSLLSLVLTRPENEILFGIGVFVLTALLIAVCWKKGEPPRWRWGGDDPLP
jgi:hypothetical protein